MTMISYDPETVKALVAACQTANDQLQKAQSLLDRIQSHGDWTCKEKSAIDERMGECRKQIGRLGERQLSFLQAVRQAEEDLCGAQRRVSSLFDGVDELLGRILSIPVQIATGGLGLLGQSGIGSAVEQGHSGTVHGGGGATVGLSSRMQGMEPSDWMRGLEDYKNPLEAISIVPFENLKL